MIQVEIEDPLMVSDEASTEEKETSDVVVTGWSIANTSLAPFPVSINSTLSAEALTDSEPEVSLMIYRLILISLDDIDAHSYHRIEVQRSASPDTDASWWRLDVAVC